MHMGLSRRRPIPYRYRNSVIKLVVIISMLLSFMLSILFLNKLQNAFLSVFVPYAVNIGSDAINFTVADYFNNNNYEYNDFVTLTYDNNNEISSLQTNSSLMNKVKADLSIYLQEEILKLKTTEMSMPLGSVFDNIVLHGLGPNIKIRISATDITDLNFNESYVDAGINQVRHKIFIDAYVKISIHCALMTKTEVIHDTVLVADTVIVGEVPKYYSERDNVPLLAGEE